MTREEAIEHAEWMKEFGLDNKTDEFLEMAIEALKKEQRTDAVSRQAVINLLVNLGYGDEENGADAQYMSALWDVAKGLEELPPVTPTRPKGKWIGYVRSNGTVYHCEKCGRKTVVKENFCPICGEDMKEGEP